MALVHAYELTAGEGCGDSLARALLGLGAVVGTMAGSSGTAILRDRKAPLRFRFLEFWEDEAARDAAGPQLPKEVMAQVMTALDGPPNASLYDRIA